MSPSSIWDALLKQAEDRIKAGEILETEAMMVVGAKTLRDLGQSHKDLLKALQDAVDFIIDIASAVGSAEASSDEMVADFRTVIAKALGHDAP